MNKTTAYIIGAVIIIGGIIWFAMGKQNTPVLTDTTTGTTQTTTTTSTGSKPTNLKELLATAAPKTCTFENNVAGNSVQATIYVANGKLRGDFVAKVGGTTSYTHTIIDSTYAYTWMDGQKTGVKTLASNTSSAKSASLDLNNLDGFNCTNAVTATPDFTKFNLPAGVTFTTVQ